MQFCVGRMRLNSCHRVYAIALPKPSSIFGKKKFNDRMLAYRHSNCPRTVILPRSLSITTSANGKNLIQNEIPIPGVSCVTGQTIVTNRGTSSYKYVLFHKFFSTSPSKLSVIEELEEEAMLPQLRGYDKVIHLLEMDLSRHELYHSEDQEHHTSHSLSSSESSQSSLCNDEDIHSTHPHHTPVLYQQICYNI